MKKSLRAVLWIVFGSYCTLMLALLFFRSADIGRSYNIVPFATIKEYWNIFTQFLGRDYGRAFFMSAVVNLAGNVLMFVPLGLLPPLLRKKGGIGWLCPLLAAGGIIAVELGQLALGVGSADIDDFLLNMLGAAMGWGIYALGRRLM